LISQLLSNAFGPGIGKVVKSGVGLSSTNLDQGNKQKKQTMAPLFGKKMKASAAKENTERGAEIKVVGGKYIGCFGYVNISKGSKGYTLRCIHCLLVDENNIMVQVRLWKKSVKFEAHDHVPGSLFELALCQCPKVEAKFNALFYELAKIHQMHSQEECVTEMGKYFANGVRQAMAETVNDPNGWTYLDESVLPS
jgi:hypothetical protein